MKRYRIFSYDFDFRINSINHIEKAYEKNPSTKLKQEYKSLIAELMLQYGNYRFRNKLQNLKDIGAKNLSILLYHNNFIEQIRDSFINENYYPALTSSCALGERILNHLIIDLRESYKENPEYEKVKDQKSFSNWKLMIEVLSNWDILLPEVIDNFKKLETLRHKSIHFNQKLVSNLRQYALDSLNYIQKIVSSQFSAFGNEPWFITSVPGEIYLKHDWLEKPFIKKYYIPNSILVGYRYKILNLSPVKVDDNFKYEDTFITDEEFAKYRKEYLKNAR